MQSSPLSVLNHYFTQAHWNWHQRTTRQFPHLHLLEDFHKCRNWWRFWQVDWHHWRVLTGSTHRCHGGWTREQWWVCVTIRLWIDPRCLRFGMDRSMDRRVGSEYGSGCTFWLAFCPWEPLEMRLPRDARSKESKSAAVIESWWGNLMQQNDGSHLEPRNLSNPQMFHWEKRNSRKLYRVYWWYLMMFDVFCPHHSTIRWLQYDLQFHHLSACLSMFQL